MVRKKDHIGGLAFNPLMNYLEKYFLKKLGFTLFFKLCEKPLETSWIIQHAKYNLIRLGILMYIKAKIYSKTYAIQMSNWVTLTQSFG